MAATLVSPGVITSEIDLSFVAPAISQTIAGIVGASRKGKLNSPIYLTRPEDAVDELGSPLLEDYGLQGLLLYLRKANQSWYTRIGSLRGDDPVATANTNTRAELAQIDATSFDVPSDIMVLATPTNKILRMRFDADNSKIATITFTGAVLSSLIRATLEDTMSALSGWINSILSSNGTAEPRLGYTTVIDGTTGKLIKFWSNSKDGELSKIEVMPPLSGASASADFGWTDGVTQAVGSRTIKLIDNLTAASADSTTQGVGGFNLGVSATMTSASAETYNLGTAAEATMKNFDNSYTPTTYSFVASLTSDTLATMNTRLATLVILQAAPYAIDPVVEMVVDGYDVSFTVALTSWNPAAITLANIQDMVDAANAAAPAGLGNFMFMNPTTGVIYVQSPGHAVGYTYIKFSNAQNNLPTGNASANVLLNQLFGWSVLDVKVQNQFTIETEGSALSGLSTISFDKATVSAYGYNPASLTAAQVATIINQQYGSTIATVDSGLNLKLTGTYKGLAAFTKAYGFNTKQESLDAKYQYALDWLYPAAADVLNMAGMVRTSNTDFNNVYLKLDFGSDYAIVKINDIAYSYIPAVIPVGQFEVVQTSFKVTAGQTTTFIAALSPVTTACVVNAPSNGYAAGNFSVGTAANFTSGLELILTDAGGLDTACRVVLNRLGNTVSTAHADEQDIVNYTITVPPTLPADVPQAGYHLRDAMGAPAVAVLDIARLYNDRDLILYIDNTPALAYAGKTLTGFSIDESYANWARKDADHTVIPTASCSVIAGTLTHAAPISVNWGNTKYAATFNASVTMAGKTYHGVFGVVPSGGTWFSDGILVANNLAAGTPATTCPVDIITLVQANGYDFVAGATRWAYMETSGGIAGNYVLKFNIDTITANAINITAITQGDVYAHTDVNYLYLSSTQTPSETYGQWATGANNSGYRAVYNETTGTYTTTSKGMISSDDYGDGFNTFAFAVDNTYVVDLDFNDYTFADQSAATASEVANAINRRARQIDISLDGVATIDSSNKVVVNSPTKGITSTLRATEDNAAMNFSAYVGAPAIGSGYPLFAFSIDGGETYSVDFTNYSGDLIVNQGAATSLEVKACLERVLGSLSGQVTINSTGVTSYLTLSSVRTGDVGEVTIVTPNMSLGNEWAVAATYNGTQTETNAATIYAVSPGTWADVEEDHIQIKFEDEDYAFFAPNTSKIIIYSNGAEVAQYREVSPDPTADGTTGPTGQGVFIEDALGNLLSITQDNNPNPWVVAELDEDLATTAEDYSGGRFKAGTYELDGGANGINGLTYNDFIGVDYSATYGGPTGLKTFADKEKIFINLLVAPGQTHTAVYNALVEIALQRRDTLFLFDPPIGLRPTQVVDWHNGRGYGNTVAFTSTYGSLDGTWLSYNDPYNNEIIYLPPSCFTLAQLAYSASISELWFPAAGLNRGRIENAINVQFSPTQGERDLMNGPGNSVNAIVNFGSDGLVIWSEKTLQRTETTTNRRSIRMLFNYLTRVVELTAKVFVFEPNDEISRKSLVAALENIMQDVAQRRGIEKFEVRDVTKSFHINQKTARILIFVTPQQSMEKIEIPFVITASGQAFIEV